MRNNQLITQISANEDTLFNTCRYTKLSIVGTVTNRNKMKEKHTQSTLNKVETLTVMQVEI